MAEIGDQHGNPLNLVGPSNPTLAMTGHIDGKAAVITTKVAKGAPPEFLKCAPTVEKYDSRAMRTGGQIADPQPVVVVLRDLDD